MFVWLLAFLLIVVVASFIAWGVEAATNSIILMLIVGFAIGIAGTVVLVRLFLRQDDLDY
jgi:hypothetical protein